MFSHTGTPRGQQIIIYDQRFTFSPHIFYLFIFNEVGTWQCVGFVPYQFIPSGPPRAASPAGKREKGGVFKHYMNTNQKGNIIQYFLRAHNLLVLKDSCSETCLCLRIMLFGTYREKIYI